MSGYRVLIHACEERRWYVKDYLLPSLHEQGVFPEIWLDDGRGNLLSCMESFKHSPRNGGTWHLQDDVVLCKDFYERTRKYNHGLIYGFSDGSDGFSFPCVRIPNDYARECAEWFFQIGREKYKDYAESGKMDDTFFNLFWKQNRIPYTVLFPCLVDHIDFLIGGSVLKNTMSIRAIDFDQKIVKELETKINGSR